MNLQTVSGFKLDEAKARMVTLQNTIKSIQLNIGAASDAYSGRRNGAMKNRMTQAEFAAIYPNPPATNMTIDDYNTIKNSQDQWGVPDGVVSETVNIEDFTALDNYFKNAQKPERSLTETEFATLYPEPTFETENAQILTAQTECNQLNSFLKSGHYPQAQYDVDLLVGTAVSYP